MSWSLLFCKRPLNRLSNSIQCKIIGYRRQHTIDTWEDTIDTWKTALKKGNEACTERDRKYTWFRECVLRMYIAIDIIHLLWSKVTFLGYWKSRETKLWILKIHFMLCLKYLAKSLDWIYIILFSIHLYQIPGYLNTNFKWHIPWFK